MGACGRSNCRKDCEDLDPQERRAYHARVALPQTHISDYTRHGQAVPDGGQEAQP